MRPKLLDLFCGMGGAAMGYYRAGFDVVGVDNVPQLDYPFEFQQRDVFAITIEELLSFDAIHASPPCQAYSKMTARIRAAGKIYPNLYPATKRLLVAIGLPYVIENVEGSPARNAVKVCGTQFGIGVQRHRLFESNVILRPHENQCSCKRQPIGNANGMVSVAGDLCTKAEALIGLGIDWCKHSSKHQVVESIPPVYTEFVGTQLLSFMSSSAYDEHQVLIRPERTYFCQQMFI